MIETVQGINIGLGAGDNDVRVGTSARSAVFTLAQAHGHFALRVRAAGDGVDAELLQIRGAAYNLGNDVEPAPNPARRISSSPAWMTTAAVAGMEEPMVVCTETLPRR